MEILSLFGSLLVWLMEEVQSPLCKDRKQTVCSNEELSAALGNPANMCPQKTLMSSICGDGGGGEW